VSIHDRWSGARKGDGRRWEVRWREGGRQCKRRFDSRGSAEAFEARRRLEPEQRQAQQGRTLTIEQLAETWLATKASLPGLKTADAYRVDCREVLATFGPRVASSILPSEVRVWAARDRGVSLRRRSLVALRQMYRLGVADGILKVDPTVGVPLPKAARAELRFLSWLQLQGLAQAAGNDPLIWLLGTAGLRLGEAIGLQVGDVRGGRIRVARQVTSTSGGLVVGPPKGGKNRDVPVAAFVLNILPTVGREPHEWLFTGSQGGRLDAHWWRAQRFHPAAEAAGLAGMHPHELRHTAASLAIASGADVKVVQRMLGHASATLTLNTYGHLFDTALDDVSARMDEAHQAASLTLLQPLAIDA
jgi:integrase